MKKFATDHKILKNNYDFSHAVQFGLFAARGFQDDF